MEPQKCNTYILYDLPICEPERKSVGIFNLALLNIFKNSNSISNNVYLGMFTYSWPAFDKYLIALQQKNFLLFENTAADMIHLLCRPLSMQM